MRCAAIRFIGLLPVLLAAGCSFRTALQYQPIPHEVEDPVTTVSLTVIDARPADYGGADKTQIGQVRGGFGNPFPLYESDAQKVALLVRAATEDALQHSKVAVHRGGSRTLVATVTEFWVDGYVGYKAAIGVHCVLQDESGAVLWTSDVTGSAGGAQVWTATGFVEPTFQKALEDYAQQAMVQFNAPSFQKHLY